MEINLNKKSPTEASIKIRLNKSDYQPQYEKKVGEYAKKMSLKGFRQGRVPSGVIKKMYGKSILVEEINHILSHKLTDYIKENDLKILGEPLPDKESTSKIDWDVLEDFEFDYNIGLVDKFDLEVSSKIKLKRYMIEVDKKSMDSTMEDLLVRFGNEVEAEKSTETDRLEVDVQDSEGTIDKKEATFSIQEIAKKEKKKFLGLKKGDQVIADAEKLFDDENGLAQLTGLDSETAREYRGKITISVNGIQRKKKAEMGQDLFDKVFGPGIVTSEADFIEKIKETVTENYQREADNHFNYSIRKYFIDTTSINLPDAFLKEWLIVANENITEEDMEREYSGYAESLKWNLITNRLSEKNKITVENDEV